MELAEKLKELEAQRTDSTHKEKSQPVVAEDISLSEFDEDFIRRVVEQVTVLSENEIEVRLMGLFYNVRKIQRLWCHNRSLHNGHSTYIDPPSSAH